MQNANDFTARPASRFLGAAGMAGRVIELPELVLRRASMLLAAAGVLALLLMLGITACNISIRPFGGNLRGTFEISGYLCALAIGLAMPLAQLSGSHINAGLWFGRVPAPLRGLSDLFCSLASCGILLAAASEIVAVAEYARDMEEYIEGFGFSYYGMALGLALGLFVHGLVFLCALFKLFVSAAKRII